MLSRILSGLMGIMAALSLLIHTLTLGLFLYLLIILRLIVLVQRAKNAIQPAIVEIARLWIGGILWWMNHLQHIHWDIECPVELNRESWYLVTANHQSWADIFVLFQVFHRRIPLLKFFIKKEMARVPVVGQAWWALDFPFMQRHSKAYLEKFPEKAGQDLEATRKACEKFSQSPTSVMNFLEGTRFTKAKHGQQKSPYRHLLKPKAGGIAFTIQALGNRFSALTNTTIVYPDGAPSFWDLMCGRLKRVVVRIESQPIPRHFTQGDYLNDTPFREEVQQWVGDLWQAKDDLIDQVLQQGAERPPV